MQNLLKNLREGDQVHIPRLKPTARKKVISATGIINKGVEVICKGSFARARFSE
jgi:hypothetical protein